MTRRRLPKSRRDPYQLSPEAELEARIDPADTPIKRRLEDADAEYGKLHAFFVRWATSAYRDGDREGALNDLDSARAIRAQRQNSTGD
jgi:hypothetical protein